MAQGLVSPLPGNGKAAGISRTVPTACKNLCYPAGQEQEEFLELKPHSGTGAFAKCLRNEGKMGLSLRTALLLTGPMPADPLSCKHSQTDQGTKCQTSLDYSHEPNKWDLA